MVARDLGAHVVVNYREADFAAAVLDETDGLGVDVCFDGVGGDVMMKSLSCLGRGGRHLVVGFASGIEAEEVPMISGRVLCFGNFDIVGVILAYRDPLDPGLAPVRDARPRPPLQLPSGRSGRGGAGPPARAPRRRCHPSGGG